MKQLIKLTFALLVAAMSLTGCSKKNELFQSVPANLQMVICADLTVLDKDLGTGPGIDREPIDNLLQLRDGLDLKNVVLAMASTSKNDVDVLAVISNRDALEKLFAEKQAKRETIGGFTVYQLAGYAYVVDGKVAHISGKTPADAVEAVKKLQKAAGEKSLAEATGVVDALTANTPYNFAMPNGDEVWGVMNSEIKGAAFEGKLAIITPEGKPVKYDGLTKVNAPLFQYAPSNTMALIALGFNEKMDWDKAFGAVNKTLASDPMTLAQIQMLEPYFKAIDGSSMIAVAPVGETLTEPVGIDSFKILAMVHMKQEMVNQAVESMKQMFGTVGVAGSGNGLWAVNINGTILYFGNVDGYLTVANFAPTANNSSTLAGEFADTYGGLSVEIPSFSIVNSRATFGLSARIKGDQGSATMTIRLTNTDRPFLPTLLAP